MSPTLNEQTPTDSHAAAPDATPAGAQQRLEEARLRLRAALDGLETAVSLQAERALEQADQSAEYTALQDDRSRLALELDGSLQRLRALETANGEAARRIERAAAAVRAVLAADAAGEL